MESSQAIRVVVTGASGLLGRAVLKAVKEQGWKGVGLSFSRVYGDLIKCDLTNLEEVKTLLEKEQPHFIIHAAAERFPDHVENQYEKTRELNVVVPANLASIAAAINSRLIYISTDYVFDGSSPPYLVSDQPKPLNKYGQTKLDGEKAVFTYQPDACVLRIPVLYGPVERLGESAITSLMNLLRTSEVQSVSHYERRYPSHVNDISSILCDLVQAISKDKRVCGIFQWSGLEQLTKYDMVRIIADTFAIPYDHLTPDEKPTPGVPRPYDSKMDNSRLMELGISHHTNFRTGIEECLKAWI